MKKASVRTWAVGVVLLQCLFGSVWAGSTSGVEADAPEPTRPMSDGQSLKGVRVSQKPMEVGAEAELLKDISSISASMVSFGVPAAKGQKVSSASARLFRGRDGYLRSIGAPGWRCRLRATLRGRREIFWLSIRRHLASEAWSWA
ncbi:MAG: hypothetical protein ACYSTJ_06135 [Planctomycetota bacterium]